jgi:hypothetical protein
MANRTPKSAWAALFNFAGGGLLHMELFPGGPTMCCEILVDGLEDLLWADGDLIYCVFG